VKAHPGGFWVFLLGFGFLLFFLGQTGFEEGLTWWFFAPHIIEYTNICKFVGGFTCSKNSAVLMYFIISENEGFVVGFLARY